MTRTDQAELISGRVEAPTAPALWKKAELAKSYRYHPHSSRFSTSGSFAGAPEAGAGALVAIRLGFGGGGVLGGDRGLRGG